MWKMWFQTCLCVLQNGGSSHYEPNIVEGAIFLNLWLFSASCFRKIRVIGEDFFHSNTLQLASYNIPCVIFTSSVRCVGKCLQLLEQCREAMVVKTFSEAHTRGTKSRKNSLVTQRDAVRANEMHFAWDCVTGERSSLPRACALGHTQLQYCLGINKRMSQLSQIIAPSLYMSFENREYSPSFTMH